MTDHGWDIMHRGNVDFCGVCLKPLERIHGTASKECCGGMKYWSVFDPMPKDLWFKKPKQLKGTVSGIPVYLYVRAPAGRRIV